MKINIEKKALSLKPGLALMEANAAGNTLAKAITDSWQPRFNVTVMSARSLDEICDRCHTEFLGKEETKCTTRDDIDNLQDDENDEDRFKGDE